MRKQRIPRASVNKFLLNLFNFGGGTNTVISGARLGKKTSNYKYAVNSINLVQDEDGIWRTRPGIAYYGSALPATVDGATQYDNDATGGRELIVIAGTKAYKSTDDGQTWTEITGATFTPGQKYAFLQYKGRLFISNGVDPLVYYDGTSLNAYTAIADPSSAPTATLGSGLSAGSYTLYYRITANNDVGNTNPSPAVSVNFDKDRDTWDKTANEYVDLSWSPVAGATSYDVWVGQISGQEVYLGSTADTTFRDYGQPTNPYMEAPDDNTTAAPRFRSMEASGNRIWGTGDPDHPYRVYGSGTGQYVGYFSPFYGGFYIDIEKGGKLKPIAVAHYRTGKGDPVMTVFTSSADGQGAIFQIELTSLTIGDTTFTVPIAYKLVGSIGADAVGSVVKVSDNIFFANKRAVVALRNKQQMFNVLAADDMIGPVRDKWESLNQEKIGDIVAYYRSPRIYFSVPTGTENDTTIIFDMERRNWNWGWTIGFKEFFEYTDSSDRTRFLAILPNETRLVEISDNYSTDLGTPFYQEYLSPLIPIDPRDYTTRAKIKNVTFELGNVSGSVSLAVLGISKSGNVSSLGTKAISGNYSNTGWGDDAFSDVQFSDTLNTPDTFTSDTLKKTIRVNNKLYYIQFRVSSNSQAFWKLLGIQAEGFFIPGKPDSSWRQ